MQSMLGQVGALSCSVTGLCELLSSGCSPQVFLPAAALLACFSCTVLIHAKHRTFCQMVPLAVSWLLDLSPVAHRFTSHNWVTGSAPLLHVLQVIMCILSELTSMYPTKPRDISPQVLLFPLSAVFFLCPIPESFSPGCYDIVGHSHQLFHLLFCIGALVQQEALLRDFLWRRPALVRELGEERLLLACASFPCLILSCVATALAGMRNGRRRLF